MAYKPNKEYTKKTKALSGAGEWWSPDKGKNIVRVMPPWDERGICIVRRVLHFGFEVDGKTRAFPCLEDNLPWLPKSPCPTCHLVSKLSSGDEDEREAAKILRPSSPRYVVQLVDCQKPDNGVQKYAGPMSFGRYFLSILEDEDIDDVTDPKKGYDLIVEVSGKGRGTSYDFRLRPKATPIPYDDWEEELTDLLKTIEVKTAKELTSLLIENYQAFDVEEYMKDFQGAASTPDVDSMTLKELKKLVKKEKLDIDSDDWVTASELRRLIKEEME